MPNLKQGVAVSNEVLQIINDIDRYGVAYLLRMEVRHVDGRSDLMPGRLDPQRIVRCTCYHDAVKVSPPVVSWRYRCDDGHEFEMPEEYVVMVTVKEIVDA